MLTLLFASRNGARTLPTMLNALTAVQPPPGGFQIIAVDNNSTDATKSILEAFSQKLPLSVRTYSKPGKNASLNSALDLARGELIVLTDDDVKPNPDWLLQLARAAENHPDCDLFGGRIYPIWPKPPANWIIDSIPLGVAYAITPDRIADGPVDPGSIWGPNMMVRRRVFDAGHRFDETVGPGPGQYVMGSETEFNYRIASKGHKTYFCNAAQVGHLIREEQLEPQWLMRRAYRFGKNMLVKEHPDLAPGFLSRLTSLPRWRYTALLDCSIRAIAEGRRPNGRRSLAARWELWYHLGYIVQNFSRL